MVSQREVINIFELEKSSLINYCKGRFLQKVADYLGVTTQYLFNLARKE